MNKDNSISGTFISFHTNCYFSTILCWDGGFFRDFLVSFRFCFISFSSAPPSAPHHSIIPRLHFVRLVHRCMPMCSNSSQFAAILSLCTSNVAFVFSTLLVPLLRFLRVLFVQFGFRLLDLGFWLQECSNSQKHFICFIFHTLRGGKMCFKYVFRQE